MLKEYLYYNVFKVLRSSVENVVSVGRQNLDSNEIVQLYALSLKLPKLIEFTTDGPRYIASVADRDPEAFEEFRTLLKEATHTSDDCIISLQGELKKLKNNYGVLADSNSNNRYSTIIRNADTGLAYLVSVGRPEDL